jgi:hypothetical protein
MDMEFFGEAMKAVGLKVVVIDEKSESPFQPLHPTLKKCKCGFIGTRVKFYDHMDVAVDEYPNAKAFWEEHGEVPLSQAEGNEFQNKKWLEGTPKNYND